MADDALPTSVDVPELREFVLAHQRSREVDRVRGEVGDALAVAAWKASQVCSISLIARSIGVKRPRIQALIHKGAALAAPSKKGAKK